MSNLNASKVSNETEQDARVIHRFLMWSIAISYLVVSDVCAQDMQRAPSGEALMTEINGLVVDETITKIGRDFYEVFYSKWEAPPSELSYTIFIKELPLVGQGSQVIIYMDDTELFTQPIQPRYDVIEAVAEYAVSLVTNYVNNYESISQQLGNEDQRGNGIF